MGAALTAQVTVVGAGISGAACASALAAAGVAVTVLDRGRAPGGRMASTSLGEGAFPDRPVDLGAAYFTVRDPAFAGVVERWQAAGLARPWTADFDVIAADGARTRSSGPMRWAAPGGLRSLVLDVLGAVPVSSGVRVETVSTGPAVDGVPADAVVLAMPDPQARRLLPPESPAAAATDEVEWEPVVTLVAGYAERCWDVTDGAFVDHPSVSFIADDGSRRGDGAPTLVVHSSAALARAHLADPSAAEQPLVDETTALLSLPFAPSWTKVHRWSYAKPSGTHGGTSFYLDTGRIGLCGDSWCPSGSPRVEAAWLSGHRLGETLAAQLANPTHGVPPDAPTRTGDQA